MLTVLIVRFAIGHQKLTDQHKHVYTSNKDSNS